jgi:hypothetical protein
VLPHQVAAAEPVAGRREVHRDLRRRVVGIGELGEEHGKVKHETVL